MKELTVMIPPQELHLKGTHCRVWETGRDGSVLTVSVDCASETGFVLRHGVSGRGIVRHDGPCEAKTFTLALNDDEVDDIWFDAVPLRMIPLDGTLLDEVDAEDESVVEDKAETATILEAEESEPESVEEAETIEVRVPQRRQFVTLSGGGLVLR